jgi:hypothetical protein
MTVFREFLQLVSECSKILAQKASATRTGARMLGLLIWIMDPLRFLIAYARLHSYRMTSLAALPYDAHSVMRVTFRHLSQEFNNQVTQMWRHRWETAHAQSRFSFNFGHKMFVNLKTFTVKVDALGLNENCFVVLHRKYKSAQLRDIIKSIVGAMLTEVDLHIAELYKHRAVASSEQHIFDLIYDNDEGICITFATKINHHQMQTPKAHQSQLFDIGQFDDGRYYFFRVRLNQSRLTHILDEGRIPQAADFSLVAKEDFLKLMKYEMQRSNLRQEIEDITGRWGALRRLGDPFKKLLLKPRP